MKSAGPSSSSSLSPISSYSAAHLTPKDNRAVDLYGGSTAHSSMSRSTKLSSNNHYYSPSNTPPSSRTESQNQQPTHDLKLFAPRIELSPLRHYRVPYERSEIYDPSIICPRDDYRDDSDPGYRIREISEATLFAEMDARERMDEIGYYKPAYLVPGKNGSTPATPLASEIGASPSDPACMNSGQATKLTTCDDRIQTPARYDDELLSARAPEELNASPASFGDATEFIPSTDHLNEFTSSNNKSSEIINEGLPAPFTAEAATAFADELFAAQHGPEESCPPPPQHHSVDGRGVSSHHSADDVTVVHIIKHGEGKGRGATSPLRTHGSRLPAIFSSLEQPGFNLPVLNQDSCHSNGPSHVIASQSGSSAGNSHSAVQLDGSGGEEVYSGSSEPRRTPSPAFGGVDQHDTGYTSEDDIGQSMKKEDSIIKTSSDLGPSAIQNQSEANLENVNPRAGISRASISTAVESSNENDGASTRSCSQQRFHSSSQPSVVGTHRSNTSLSRGASASNYNFDERRSCDEKDYEALERQWDLTYSSGSMKRHRENVRSRTSECDRFQYPTSGDPKFPYYHKKTCTTYECFNLKVIFERDKTGREDSRELPAELGSTVAGRYRVLAHLGQAAFSRAIKCYDEWENREVCIKVIKNEKDFVDQSLDEVKVLRYVDSNGDVNALHCLKMHDFFYHKEHLIIVTELLKDNLYELIRKGRQAGSVSYFTLGRIQLIARQVLEALAFIHSLRLIHCDLKPENILMKNEDTGEVKVIDFGSSCFEDDDLAVYVQSRSYRAPEILLKLPYDQKIDIWSLGCILAELWTGFVLFQNDGVVSLMTRIVGIIGHIPYYMARRSHAKLFTRDGQLYETINGPSQESRVPHLNEGRDKTSDRLMYRILLPKQSSLKQRLRTDDLLFVDFLRSLLTIDPAERPTAIEALQHPWLHAGRYADGI
eukprot:GHVN01068374.1.p1 GENE.GHVN01068374.1~~GHVN01068374.1.p1  ORF type:complete len:1065 (+),score=109.93 GHVN01068374.1:378-3197(+)